MTAGDFSIMVHAQRTGKGRWKAKCPAHRDRSPSLSIREGQDGRVLLKCFAGCTLEAILSELRLTVHDLFAGPPPTPEQLAALRAAQEARQRAADAERKARHDALIRVEKLQAVVNALGAKLARAPDNDALAKAFHSACDLLHKAELVDEKWNPARRESAREKEAA